MEALLEARGLGKSFGIGPQRSEVLRSVDLQVMEGEFVAVVGFSGSGKSTLVHLLAGLLEPDQGTLFFAGQENPPPGPERGLVFQNYSLLPWLTVYDNVRLAVDQVFPKHARQERDERVRHYLEMVSLTPALQKRPGELSGGMRQRVSLARTLAMSPSLLLLDEPLGALDALTRATLQDEIARLRREQDATVVLITNDVDEALLLSDRILTLTPGPRATLGREFTIELPHPRDRHQLNRDDRFKALRNGIVAYLGELRTAARRSERLGKSAHLTPPPHLTPADLRV
jgi:nitrate/nitrite transport system ATP-binding protein